jgi:hypothetical protein
MRAAPISSQTRLRVGVAMPLSRLDCQTHCPLSGLIESANGELLIAVITFSEGGSYLPLPLAKTGWLIEKLPHQWAFKLDHLVIEEDVDCPHYSQRCRWPSSFLAILPKSDSERINVS